MKKQATAIKLVEDIVRKQMRRKLTEAKLETDPLKAYLQTALWASSDENDDPLDSNYSINDFAPGEVNKAKIDLKNFVGKLKTSGLLGLYKKEYDLSQLAHDFWLTRNGHGAGFWDRSYSNDAPDGSDLGDAITKIADSFRETSVYVGDDGKLYFE